MRGASGEAAARRGARHIILAAVALSWRVAAWCFVCGSDAQQSAAAGDVRRGDERRGDSRRSRPIGAGLIPGAARYAGGKGERGGTQARRQ